MTSPSHKFTVKTVDRFRSPNCDVNGHPNSHITREAALKCAGAKDATLTTVSRFWGQCDGVTCGCKFGHKTREQALSCVGGDRKPAAATKPTAKPATAKPTAKPKATGKPATGKPRALRSVSTGAASRA